jgi:hypothetical protein
MWSWWISFDIGWFLFEDNKSGLKLVDFVFEVDESGLRLVDF